LILPLAGCSDFIAPPTSDPNAVPEASINQLFVAHQANQYLWHGGTQSRFVSVWMQQMGGIARQHQTLELYTFTEQNFNNIWEPVYQGGGLVDIKKARAAAAERGDRKYEGILKIHEAFMIGMTAAAFGDIPYSQAVDPEIAEPVLDEQLAVYASVLSLLDAAISDLESGQGLGPVANDFNFTGDASSWIAAAYSLKARFNLHLVEVDGNSRYTQALAAAQQGISDVSGNWTQRHSTAATENNNWFNWEERRGGDIRGNNLIIGMMNGGTPGDMSDDDPRLKLYWKTGTGDFVGQYIGHTTANHTASDPGTDASWLLVPGADQWNQPILTCSETQFIIAEAQSALGNDAGARTAAKDAIDCQEDQWSVDLSDIKADFDAASGAALFDLIMEQKFVGQFLNIDTWNDFKRTCKPYRPPALGSQVVGRFLYAQQERTTNSNIPLATDQPDRNDNDPNQCAP
jgi:hypothetical protein